MTAPAEVPPSVLSTTTGPPIIAQARPLEMTCPNCGGLARWWWTRTRVDGTEYERIDCDVCWPDNEEEESCVDGS